MSVVIIGGHECMERQYKDLCQEYGCDAKVFTKQKGSLKCIGSPDIMVLFTNTVSHKMVKNALNESKNGNTRVVRSHTSSMSALKGILQANVPEERSDNGLGLI